MKGSPLIVSIICLGIRSHLPSVGQTCAHGHQVTQVTSLVVRWSTLNKDPIQRNQSINICNRSGHVAPAREVSGLM